MAEFKILQENGVDIYPITHPNAVRDENGKSVTEMIDEVRDDWELIGETIFTEDTPTTVNAIMFNKPYGFKKILMLFDQTQAATQFNGRFGLYARGKDGNPNYYIISLNKVVNLQAELIDNLYVDVRMGAGTYFVAPSNTTNMLMEGKGTTYYDQGIDGLFFAVSKIYANTKVTIYGIKK